MNAKLSVRQQKEIERSKAACKRALLTLQRPVPLRVLSELEKGARLGFVRTAKLRAVRGGTSAKVE